MRMATYVETRWSPAAPWARRFATLSLATLIVALGAHWFRILDTPSFFWSLAIVAGLAVFALALTLAGLPKVWYEGYRGGTDIILAGLVSSALVAVFGLAFWWATTHPPLTDISTDLDDPPQFAQALEGRTRDMNPVLTASDLWKSEQNGAYPAVTGRRYALPIESVRLVAERMCEERGWAILGPYVVGQGDEFNIEATVYTSILALPSDVVIRLFEEDESTFVDMRSTSRYGSTDFGSNAERIQAFLKDLDVAVAAASPVAAEPPTE